MSSSHAVICARCSCGWTCEVEEVTSGLGPERLGRAILEIVFLVRRFLHGTVFSTTFSIDVMTKSRFSLGEAQIDLVRLMVPMMNCKNLVAVRSGLWNPPA
jgi:hypothetical protein